MKKYQNGLMEELKKKFLSLINSSTFVYSLIGLILIGFGVLIYKTDIFSASDKVEVIQSPTATQTISSEIIVEISGSVEKPGVYKMKMGDRINDLLIISGGLSINADRNWVDKNINKASKLVDGNKYYIYHLGEVSAKNNGGIKLDQGVLGVTNEISAKLININTSSQLELEKLVGIGPVYAKNIIEHRPYSETADLVKKGVLSSKVFDKIKNEITVY